MPRLSARVALLAAALLVLVVAGGLLLAGRSTADEPGVQLSAANPPAATPEPTPTPTPEPPPVAPMSVEVEPASVGTGETLLVRVHAPGAAQATVVVLGRSYPAMREGGGDALWAVVPIPLETPTGSHTLVVRTRDAEGAELERSEVALAVVEVDRPIDHVELTPDQASVLTPEAVEYERQLRIEQFVVFDRPRRWEGPWLSPTDGVLTTPFGEGRSYNGGPVTSRHLGLDIANAAGTPIIAPAPGRVAWVGEMPMRGNSVLLDHGAGVVSGYHHLLEWLVEVGDYVEPGGVIALMGSTGLSTGPHLHWEISIYGVNVDPATWTQTAFVP